VTTTSPENASAWERGLPRGFLAIGDDGAGNPFCVSSDSESPEVSRWDWIDLDFESSEGQLADFLEAWVEPPT
jgi:hypothetical protein